MQQTCGKCGSVYELTEHKLPTRDKDSLPCGVCGEELHSWNGACCFTAKLLTRGKPPQRQESGTNDAGR